MAQLIKVTVVNVAREEWMENNMVRSKVEISKRLKIINVSAIEGLYKISVEDQKEYKGANAVIYLRRTQSEHGFLTESLKYREHHNFYLDRLFVEETVDQVFDAANS